MSDSVGYVTQTLDYYPYGSERISSGSNVSDRHYIGERYDPGTQLSYLNARYYSGTRGQFISQDPVFVDINKMNLANPQELNSYSYAIGNPITGKDPTGATVELVSRPVNLESSRGAANGIFGHTFLLITPENPSTIGKIDGMNTSATFTMSATLSNGQLIKSPNGDIRYANGCGGCAKVLVKPPKGVSQEQFEANLVNGYNSMTDILHKNYGEFLGEGDVWGNPNSNNAATSFLTNAGVSLSKINYNYQASLFMQNSRLTPGLGVNINGSATAQIISQLSNIVNSLQKLVSSLGGNKSNK